MTTEARLDALLQERDHILIQINLAENGGKGSLDVLERELTRVATEIAEHRRQSFGKL